MKKILCLLIVALFCSSFSVQAQTSKDADVANKKELKKEKKSKKKSKNPQITFSFLEYDYGQIYQGDNGTCEFEFKNTGKSPLLITNARSSCGCTVPEWPKTEIAPGKKGVIKVKYDTNRIGAIHKTITISSNAETASVTLRIKGNVSQKPVQGVPTQEAPMMKAN